MMLNLKKTTLFVLIISWNNAFSGTMDPVCNPILITSPCENLSWELGARALYWNIGNANYQSSTTTAPSGSKAFNLGPEFGWGFQINGAMNYSNGKSISLDWYHIRTTGIKSQGPQFITSNPYLNSGAFNYLGGVVTNSSITSREKLDDVNMLFGQHTDYSGVTSSNLGWGWKWARVASNFNASSQSYAEYNSISEDNVIQGFIVNNSSTTQQNFSFSGFGPEVSLLGEYRLFNYLNIYGKGEFSALAGYSRNLNGIQSVRGGYAATSSKVLSISPVISGKLGANYGWDLSGYGTVMFDINYDFREYINAFRGAIGLVSNSFNAQGITFGLDFLSAHT